MHILTHWGLVIHIYIRARFLSLAPSKLRLCSANHRAGYFSNLACDWLSIVWAYSEQETENGPRTVQYMVIISAMDCFLLSTYPGSYEWLTHWPLGDATNFKLVVLKLISRIGILTFSCELALRRMPQYLIDNVSTVVQVMTWCCQATSHYLSQCWPRCMLLYGITRSQWDILCRLPRGYLENPHKISYLYTERCVIYSEVKFERLSLWAFLY